ncbi:FHA domain-containing protein [Balneolaceae bacterium ANBcel3]|nr:FHA domain-containing protein [Balneolaceae bacterium ANBcel3]
MLSTSIAQVSTTVADINNNPGGYINEHVEVEGLVTQYVPGSSTTLAHYVIRDDMGAEIQVNTTTGPPETNVKHRVSGVLYHENRNLFISELTRSSLEPDIIIPETVEPAGQDNTLLYIIALTGILIVSLLMYVVLSNRKKPKQKNASAELDAHKKTPIPASVDSKQHEKFLNSDGENTIVLDREYLTMKAMPGKLRVMNGEQADSTLSLFGANSTDGQVITIGRDSPDWKKHLKKGRENAHIRIQDSSKTLSRLQAELIFNNGTFKLRNLGQANPTVVDDKTLDVGETAELKDSSVIQAGNLKLKYEL